MAERCPITQLLGKRRRYPRMQVCANLATSGLHELSQRDIAFRLGRDGVIYEVDRPYAEAVEDLLRYALIAQLAHTGMGAQEWAVPIKFGFGINGNNQYRRSRGERSDLSLGGGKKRGFP